MTEMYWLWCPSCRRWWLGDEDAVRKICHECRREETA